MWCVVQVMRGGGWGRWKGSRLESREGAYLPRSGTRGVAQGPGGESLVRWREDTRSRRVWSRRGDMVLIPLVPRPLQGPTSLLPLLAVTHTLCSISLNECGFAVVEVGFGAACIVT